jgi:hypothetical protein
MKLVRLGDGYRFEGVGTKESELVVLWSRDGEDCPPAQVRVENCASMFGLARLGLHVPSEMDERCPGLQSALGELSAAVRRERPVGHGVALATSAWPALIAVAGILFMAGLPIRRLLAREVWQRLAAEVRRGGTVSAHAPTSYALTSRWQDIGWLGFVVAAATPFFFNVPFAVTMELAAAWVVFALLLLDADLLAAERRAQQLSLLGLFCFSLLLHWSLSSGGPGDLRLNLSVIWSSGLELRWGPAPIAFFRLLALVLGGLQDTGILWCNLVLSSLLPILLYAIVSQLGVGKAAALLAAGVTAAHPLAILWSGVLVRQPTYLFAVFGSTLALIGFLQRGKRRRFLAFVLGAVLATTSRPEGAHVVILYLAVLLVVPANRPARQAVALALALLTPLAFVYIRYVLEMGGGQALTGHRLPVQWTILFSRDFTPLAWIVAWTLGLLFGVRQRAAWVALVVLVGLDITWRWTGLYEMFVGHERQVASTRYESILLVPFAIGTGLLFQTALQARRWLKVCFGVAFVACTATTFGQPYETVLRPFTVDYEYEFLRKHALTLPPHSRLYVLDPPIDDTGFLDANAVGQFVGSEVRFEIWSERQCDDLTRDPSQVYLYIGSSCAELQDNDPSHPLFSVGYARWLQDCASIRARVAGDLVEELDVPARKMSWHDFRDSTVRLALYRLKDVSTCVIGPLSPTRHFGE